MQPEQPKQLRQMTIEHSRQLEELYNNSGDRKEDIKQLEAAKENDVRVNNIATKYGFEGFDSKVKGSLLWKAYVKKIKNSIQKLDETVGGLHAVAQIYETVIKDKKNFVRVGIEDSFGDSENFLTKCAQLKQQLPKTPGISDFIDFLQKDYGSIKLALTLNTSNHSAAQEKWNSLRNISDENKDDIEKKEGEIKKNHDYDKLVTYLKTFYNSIDSIKQIDNVINVVKKLHESNNPEVCSEACSSVTLDFLKTLKIKLTKYIGTLPSQDQKAGVAIDIANKISVNIDKIEKALNEEFKAWKQLNGIDSDNDVEQKKESSASIQAFAVEQLQEILSAKNLEQLGSLKQNEKTPKWIKDQIDLECKKKKCENDFDKNFNDLDKNRSSVEKLMYEITKSTKDIKSTLDTYKGLSQANIAELGLALNSQKLEMLRQTIGDLFKKIGESEGEYKKNVENIVALEYFDKEGVFKIQREYESTHNKIELFCDANNKNSLEIDAQVQALKKAVEMKEQESEEDRISVQKQKSSMESVANKIFQALNSQQEYINADVINKIDIFIAKELLKFKTQIGVYIAKESSRHAAGDAELLKEIESFNSSADEIDKKLKTAQAKLMSFIGFKETKAHIDKSVRFNEQVLSKKEQVVEEFDKIKGIDDSIDDIVASISSINALIKDIDALNTNITEEMRPVYEYIAHNVDRKAEGDTQLALAIEEYNQNDLKRKQAMEELAKIKDNSYKLLIKYADSLNENIKKGYESALQAFDRADKRSSSNEQNDPKITNTNLNILNILAMQIKKLIEEYEIDFNKINECVKANANYNNDPVYEQSSCVENLKGLQSKVSIAILHHKDMLSSDEDEDYSEAIKNRPKFLGSSTDLCCSIDKVNNLLIEAIASNSSGANAQDSIDKISDDIATIRKEVLQLCGIFGIDIMFGTDVILGDLEVLTDFGDEHVNQGIGKIKTNFAELKKIFVHKTLKLNDLLELKRNEEIKETAMSIVSLVDAFNKKIENTENNYNKLYDELSVKSKIEELEEDYNAIKNIINNLWNKYNNGFSIISYDLKEKLKAAINKFSGITFSSTEDINNESSTEIFIGGLNNLLSKIRHSEIERKLKAVEVELENKRAELVRTEELERKKIEQEKIKSAVANIENELIEKIKSQNFATQAKLAEIEKATKAYSVEGICDVEISNQDIEKLKSDFEAIKIMKDVYEKELKKLDKINKELKKLDKSNIDSETAASINGFYKKAEENLNSVITAYSEMTKAKKNSGTLSEIKKHVGECIDKIVVLRGKIDLENGKIKTCVDTCNSLKIENVIRDRNNIIKLRAIAGSVKESRDKISVYMTEIDACLKTIEEIKQANISLLEVAAGPQKKTNMLEEYEQVKQECELAKTSFEEAMSCNDVIVNSNINIVKEKIIDHLSDVLRRIEKYQNGLGKFLLFIDKVFKFKTNYSRKQELDTIKNKIRNYSENKTDVKDEEEVLNEVNRLQDSDKRFKA